MHFKHISLHKNKSMNKSWCKMWEHFKAQNCTTNPALKLKSAPFCHYLIFDSVVGAYVTADARSQHVAQQPAAQGHSSIPLLGFFPPFHSSCGRIVSKHASVGLLPLHDATGTRTSAGAEAPSVGRGLHMRLSGWAERLLPRIKRRNRTRLSICKRLKHKLENVLLINQKRDRENKHKSSYFSNQANYLKMLQTPKILERLRRPDTKHETIWKTSPTCLSASTGRVVSEIHSCSGRFLPVQPGSGFFFVCGKKASPPNFMQWGGREKKRKSWLNRKWWRSCMEIILEPELETQNQGRAGHMKRYRWSSARFRAV